MGRYSPTVVPQVPDPLQVVDSMWSGYLGYQQNQRAEKGLGLEERGLDIREQEAGQRAESLELERYREGFRKGQAPKTVPEENLPSGLRGGRSVFGEGPQPIGLQPGEAKPLRDARGETPSLGAQLGAAASRYQPDIVAKPGALVPGANVFADRPIHRQELEPPPVYGGMVTDPRYEQVTPEYYMDPEATPEARTLNRQVSYDEARQGLDDELAQAEIARRTDAAIAAGYSPEQAAAVANRMPLPPDQDPDNAPMFTPNQAYQIKLREHYVPRMNPDGTPMVDGNGNPIYEMDGTSPEQILQEAYELVQPGWGLGDEPQPMDEGYAGGVLGGQFLPETIPFGELLEQYRTDPFGTGRETEETEVQMQTGLSMEEIEEARSYLVGLSPDEQRAELVDLGFSTADIERIIGG
jgi:hypothetical protein